MLIEQVNGINLQPLERPFHGPLDLLRPTVYTCRSRAIIAAAQIESELGGDHHSALERRKRLAHQFFVGEWTIDLGGVKERDAAVHGGVEKSGHLLLIFGGGRRKSSFPCSPGRWLRLPNRF